MSQTKDSFLSDSQRAGKATGKVDVSHLDEVIGRVHCILNEEEAALLKNDESEAPPTNALRFYCQDCRQLTVPQIKPLRNGKSRLVCGECRGIKLARGSESALTDFYRLKEAPAAGDKPAPRSEPKNRHQSRNRSFPKRKNHPAAATQPRKTA